MIKKKKSKGNTSSKSHRGFQRRKDKTENKGPRNKNQKRTAPKKTRKQYEQTYTCSGTISSSMYDSDFSITRSNRKTEPCYWLGTNNNTRR